MPRLANWHSVKQLHLVHHADVAQALLRAISAKGNGGIYNMAHDAPISISELRSFYKHPEPSNADDLPLLNPWEGIANTLK